MSVYCTVLLNIIHFIIQAVEVEFTYWSAVFQNFSVI